MGDDVADIDYVAAVLGCSRAVALKLTARDAKLYQRFPRVKPNGGVRMISAPVGELKAAQWHLSQWLGSYAPASDSAHGFVAGRSVVTNAMPHVRRAVVVKMDVDGFFPSVGFRRVEGIFLRLGVQAGAARMLAVVATEPRDGDGRITSRVLPQGAPSSPAVTNVVCRKLDRRLAGLARAHEMSFTRYADDITLSGDGDVDAAGVVRSVAGILRDEGFEANESKTLVMLAGERQTVTGVVVNRRLEVPPEFIVATRSLARRAPQVGTREADELAGRLSWIGMIDREVAVALCRELGIERTFRPAVR